MRLSAPTVRPALACLQDDVDGRRMMDTLGRLVGWTKLAGSQSEAESLAFLRQQLDAMGFATSLIWHDAYISLPGRARLEVDGLSYHAITHSMGLSSPAPGLTAGIRDAGGGSEAELQGLDGGGNVLLVDGIASPDVARRASRAGAAAVVHVSPHEHLHEMCVSPVWGNPSCETVGDLPTCVVVTISRADGGAVRARLRFDRNLRATLHAEVSSSWRKTPILVAHLPSRGAEGDEPFVLLSGHHDAWHYGAMDNGSANASMLEVARLCASRRAKWHRGLRLCFWSGHSQGRYSGSAWYADEHWADLERHCVAHVNVDSLGAVGATVLAETGAMAELRTLAAQAIAAETGQRLAGRRKARAADDSFGGIGIPSMFGSLSRQPRSADGMRNALGWWWHTPEDLIDKIDETNLVRDTRIVLDVVWHLLTDEILPLDYVAKVDDLLAVLEPLQTELKDVLDLSDLVETAHLVRLLAAAVGTFQSGADPKLVNHVFMRLSRTLVPLDYTSGDRFSHDPALSQPAWPMLDPLRRLAAAPVGTSQHYLAQVSAVRARNRVAFHLGEAVNALTLVVPLNAARAAAG
jgi:hypothetical protein